MSDLTYRLWDLGQRHLAAGRYVAAVGRLQAAEAMAWGSGDVTALARIHLPLLEARRLIRQQAAEGTILIAADPPRAAVADFFKADAGTLLCGDSELVHMAKRTSQLTGRRLEGLLILSRGGVTRLIPPADAHFTAGLPVHFGSDQPIGESTDPALVVPLPAPGLYTSHAIARESLIIGWEALALRWQSRHPLARRVGPWEELAWLRQALRIDPACEPVAMRLMALAEQAARLKR